MKIRIKTGTLVYQDFQVFRWPGKYEDQARVEFKIDGTRLFAKGFGIQKPGQYGNGAIYVVESDGSVK